MTRIVDGHAHVGRWRSSAFSGRATTLADAEALYRRLGYAGALVMPTDEADNRGLLEAIEASSFPFRFCLWIDPEDDELPAFAEARADRIAALKIHPSLVGRRCTDAGFDRWFDWAAERGVPVLVHCGRWQEMASWRLGLERAEARPDVTLILCHMGGDGSDLVEETVGGLAERELPNVRLGTESIRQYWVVQRAVDRLGARPLIFGSDYNLNHPRSFQAVVEALEVDEEARRGILADHLDAVLPSHLRFGTATQPE